MPPHGRNVMDQKALHPFIHPVLFYYHPEEKTDLINFVDMLYLCKGYALIREDLLKNNKARAKSLLLPCKNPILFKNRENCFYCCKNSLNHLIKIYEDISNFTKIAENHRHKFIQELFGKNFLLPEIPITIIGKYMVNTKIRYISPPECLPQNLYMFESDPQLSKLYKTYSYIFAGLSLACYPERSPCTRANNIKELFGNIKFHKLSYSQIICKCNKKRLQSPTCSASLQDYHPV